VIFFIALSLIGLGLIIKESVKQDKEHQQIMLDSKEDK
jgi:hypothetical protein